ncbi:3-hydroxyacyl-CoA dehydrogenase, partial [Candidatus Bathyarchaeota archaeon]
MIEGIRRVACVGSGLIGQGWAALFSLNGYEVVLQDLSEDKLAEAVERVRGHVDSLVQAGFGGSLDEAMSRIETTTELSEALKGA